MSNEIKKMQLITELTDDGDGGVDVELAVLHDGVKLADMTDEQSDEIIEGMPDHLRKAVSGLKTMHERGIKLLGSLL